jgi:hypothetical protein
MMTNKKHMYTRNIRNTKNIRKIMKNATKITKKYKDHFRNKNLSIGGADLSNDQTASEIMNQVKNERKFNINNFNLKWVTTLPNATDSSTFNVLIQNTRRRREICIWTNAPSTYNIFLSTNSTLKNIGIFSFLKKYFPV